MKIAEAWVSRFEQSLPSQIAVLFVVSVLFWALGVPAFIKQVNAANMSQISDTLSDSNNGSIAKHTITFTTSTSTKATQTIKIQLDPDTSAFDEFFSTATTTDISVSGFTQVADAAACSVAVSEAYPVGNYNNGSDENLTYTVCPADTIPAGTITIGVGTTTKLWQNPNPAPGPGGGTNTAASYRITIGGTSAASGETRVAIVPHITLTASVASTFTFTITGVPTGNTVGSDVLNTVAPATETSIPFGELASGTPRIAAQRLNVTTNASNGFSVTVQENQPMTGNSGSTIYLFKDGATTSVPTAWTHPSATLNAYQTYGHLGITSTDADLNSNEFSNATLYAGNIIQPRVIFSHNGPTNGITDNQGSTTVAYKVESTDLLPAGDYTNTVTYVATPTF